VTVCCRQARRQSFTEGSEDVAASEKHQAS